MMPSTFDEWKYCIVKKCGIELTKEFAQKRLLVYGNEQNEETQKFVSLYGKKHLENIIKWLKQI